MGGNSKIIIQIESLEVEDLRTLMRNVFRDEIQNLKHELNTGNPKKQEQLLTKKELCELLNISETTAWSWQKSGKIKCHSIGGRRYYKLSELENSLKLKGN